jgi:hypothetical protein
MTRLSPPPSVTGSQTRSAPPVVHGLMYGVFASLAMWGAIAMVAAKLI